MCYFFSVGGCTGLGPGNWSDAGPSPRDLREGKMV